MDNLLQESFGWLQTGRDSQEDIKRRTRRVLIHFGKFLRKNQAEIKLSAGLEYQNSAMILNQCINHIDRALNYGLRGDYFDAIKIIKDYCDSFTEYELKSITPLYKCRRPSNNKLFSQDEMFHIPFDKRSKVENQRFSISGLPCLYLGGSSYICWEELGRGAFDSMNFCGYKSKAAIRVLDLTIPSTIKTVGDIKRVAIILACSLSANREDFFKAEYIIPQLILQALILKYKEKTTRKIFGVRYYSSHLLNGDADFFDNDANSTEQMSRYVNYVFPCISDKAVGYNEVMRNSFIQTRTVTLNKELLINPARLTTGMNADKYLSSQFGLLDSILDEYLGLSPKRQEGEPAMFLGEGIPVSVEVNEEEREFLGLKDDFGAPGHDRG